VTLVPLVSSLSIGAGLSTMRPANSPLRPSPPRLPRFWGPPQNKGEVECLAGARRNPDRGEEAVPLTDPGVGR